MELSTKDKVTVAKRKLHTFEIIHYTQPNGDAVESLDCKWEHEKLIDDLQRAQNAYYNELRQTHVYNDITRFADWMWKNNIVDCHAVQGKWYNQRDGYYIQDSSELYSLYLSEQ